MTDKPASARFPIPVAVLGATGAVGQRFIQLLERHPWFRVAAVTGSQRSVGRAYAEACHWILPTPIPPAVAALTVQPSDVDKIHAPLAFSALPGDEASLIEPRLAQAGVAVCSNASAYRPEPDVPLLLPEVNPEHTALIERQRRERGLGGLHRHQPQLHHYRADHRAQGAPAGLWRQPGVHRLHASHLRGGLPRRAVAGCARQRGALHRRGREQDGVGAAEDARALPRW